MKKVLFLQGILCALLLPALSMGATVTTLAKNGPDADKIVIAIIGDGYAAGDMSDYKDLVDKKVMEELFVKDNTIFENRSAFNIYRIDVESNDSGVSEWNYDYDASVSADCTTLDPDCYVRRASNPGTTHDTALGFVATSVWAHCWIRWVVSEADTTARLQSILNEVGIQPDKTIIFAKTSRLVGCGGGPSLIVNDSTSYTTLAHEMGHMTAGLRDEYTKDRKYTGNLNSKNCSTVLDESNVVWSDFLEDDISIPTTWDASTMDADETVGMFEGCNTYDEDIYRPVYDCRMNGNSNQFCPVCQNIWEDEVAGNRDDSRDYTDLSTYPGSMCKGVGTDLVYTSAAQAGNSATAAKWAVCPARRFREGTSFTNRFFATAWVKDRSATEDVCCRTRTRNPGGSSTDGTQVCTSGSSSSYKQLSLDFPKVYDNYTWSHIEVLCNLPAIYNGARSEILTYRMGQERF